MARGMSVAVLGCAALLAIALSSGTLPAVLLGSPYQQLDQTNFDVSRWTQRHMNSVAENGVDDQTAKGIWHSKNQAWAGIDEVLPTDTPYEYQTIHSGGGEEVKMRAFLEHANTQLRTLAKSLPKSAAGEDGKRLSTLKKLLSAGEKALKGIEVQTAQERDPDHAAKVAWAQQLSVLPAARPTQLATNSHYENAESASDDLDSYFDTLGRQTASVNARNAHKAGNRRVRRALSSTGEKATQILQAAPMESPRAAPNKNDMKRFARMFAVQLAAALKESATQTASLSMNEQAPDGAPEACVLCMKIAGCMDCCSPVCQEPDAAPKTARPAANQALFHRLAALEGEVGTLEKGSSRGRGVTAARKLCDCQTAECRECPDSDAEEARASKVLRLVEEKEQLHKAEKAVAVTNAILRERVAAANALDKMAIHQGLGAYGDLSDDAVWPAREPFPGKSEQIASGAADSVGKLSKQLFGAKKQIAQMKAELHAAENAAIHGAVVTAKERSIIDKLKGRRQWLHYSAGRVAPYYKQPAYGGDAVSKMVKRFGKLTTAGQEPKY